MSDNSHAAKIYRRALDTFGAEAQIFMVMEEMSELQKELCKNFRGKENVDSIAEEIADVEIMLEQMKILFCVGDSVREWKEQKIRRLWERIQQAQVFPQDPPWEDDNG